MAVVEYIVTKMQFKQINENINLINLSFERVAELENIVSKVKDLELLNLGLYHGDLGDATTGTTEEKAAVVTAAETQFKSSITH